MIRIHILKKKDNIDSIIFEGHALYDNYGKDIICASVSSIYFCTINAIYALNEKSIIVTSEKEKQMIKVKIKDNIIQTLLQNMINCLERIEKQYPKNIKLDKEEE